LLDAYEVDGTYVEQIGSATSHPCFDTAHGHSVGGGDYWASGYNTLLHNLDRRENVAFVTESNSEPYMGNLTGYLVIAGMYNCPVVNMFSAVYGGYIVPLGQIFQQQDLMNPTWFAVKMANMFVLGVQLGWFSLGGDIGIYDQIIQPQYQPQVELVTSLIQHRALVLNYLLHGRMMRTLEIFVVQFYRVDDCHTSTMPVSVWSSQAGDSLLILAVNALDSPQSLEFVFEMESYNLSPTSEYEVSRITLNSTSLIGKYTGSFSYLTTVDTYNIVMISISPPQKKYQPPRVLKPIRIRD